MKRNNNILLAIAVVSFCILLSACQPANADVADDVPNGTTTKGTEILATTNDASTTIDTAEKSITVTTTTTELSITATTTTTVAGDGEILAPKEQWPDADKQRLTLQVAGEPLSLVFDRATPGDGLAYWHYTGKTKRGHSVSCKVLDGRIVNVHIDVTGDNGDYLKEEEVRTFLLSELKELGFGESFEQVDIFMQFSMLEENKHNTGIFHVFLPGNERLHGSVCRSGGRIYLRTLSTTGSDQTPKLTEHEFDYLIPNWC